MDNKVKELTSWNNIKDQKILHQHHTYNIRKDMENEQKKINIIMLYVSPYIYNLKQVFFRRTITRNKGTRNTNLNQVPK